MSHATVELRGFEAAFFAWLATAFRFSDPSLSSVPLTSGRHFFVNYMPEVGQIVKTSAQDAIVYNPATEPTIAAYTNAGPGIRTGVSRWIKHEASLNIILRVSGTFEKAKGLLEDLVREALNQATGKRMGEFLCKAATLTQRPTAFQRADDDRSFAQATVRFLYVALNQ